MNERPEHKPLTRQERFVLNAVSTGLTREELAKRIDSTRKLPDDAVFPPYFGQNTLDLLIRGLLEKGFIKEVLVASEKGQKELSEQRRYTVRPPAPVIRPFPRRAEPSGKPTPRPASQVRTAEPAKIEPKPTKEKMKTVKLDELSKFRDEFRKE